MTSNLLKKAVKSRIREDTLFCCNGRLIEVYTGSRLKIMLPSDVSFRSSRAGSHREEEGKASTASRRHAPSPKWSHESESGPNDEIGPIRRSTTVTTNNAPVVVLQRRPLPQNLELSRARMIITHREERLWNHSAQGKVVVESSLANLRDECGCAFCAHRRGSVPWKPPGCATKTSHSQRVPLTHSRLLLCILKKGGSF